VNPLTRYEWFAKRFISKRMKAPLGNLQLNPRFTQVENTALQSAIEAALVNRLCALHVLYAPQDAGKTYATVRAVRRLQDERKIGGELLKTDVCVYSTNVAHSIGALLIEDASTVNRFNDLHLWLKSTLRLSPALGCEKLWELLPQRVGDDHKPVVLVLDQFNDAASHRHVNSFITSLAAGCVKHKNLVVLVVVNNKPFHERILQMNGGRKIMSVQTHNSSSLKWSREQLSVLFDEQVRP
jgi:hypothetical protein